MTSSSLPFLELSGSAEVMGYEHGSRLATQISSLFENRLRRLLQGCPSASVEDVRIVCSGLWDDIVVSLPEVASEVRATCAGSELEPWQLVVAGAYTDVGDALGGFVESGSECTVAVRSSSSMSIFGTWDSHPEAGEAAVVVRRRPDAGPATLALTTAGWPCQFGLNSEGLGFGITNLTPEAYTRRGLVYISAIAHASSLQSVRQVSSFLRKSDFCSGHSYLLADSGDAMIAETSPAGYNEYRVVTSKVEANHYMSGIDSNDRYPFYTGSIDRVREMSGALEELVNPQDFFTWVSSSQTVFRREITGPATTCAIFAIDLRVGRLSVGRQADSMQEFLLSSAG